MVNNFFLFFDGRDGRDGRDGAYVRRFIPCQNLYTALTPMLRPGLYALVICSTSRLVPFE